MSARMRKIDYAEGFGELCKALNGDGAFLLVQDRTGKANPMTIGWATLGVVWGMPALTVLVRPSRYTFGLIEEAKGFSVNVPKRPMSRELGFCGSRSGRDCDKAAESGLKIVKGLTPGISVLRGRGLVYECETVGRTHILREQLDPAVVSRYYGSGDFHTVYFGKVLQAYRE